MDKHLAEMTLDEILDRAGHDCSCGKHHSCELKYMKIGKGVVKYLPEGMAAIGVKKPFVVMDCNTKKAAGALQWAVANNILKGVPFTNATETATRAQTAQMLTNFLNK